jgi:hypothetical protein
MFWKLTSVRAKEASFGWASVPECPLSRLLGRPIKKRVDQPCWNGNSGSLRAH